MDDLSEKLRNLERRMQALDTHNVCLSHKVRVLLERSDGILRRADQLCHKAVVGQLFIASVYSSGYDTLTNHN
jgi:hypothetical protein